MTLSVILCTYIWQRCGFHCHSVLYSYNIVLLLSYICLFYIPDTVSLWDFFLHIFAEEWTFISMSFIYMHTGCDFVTVLKICREALILTLTMSYMCMDTLSLLLEQPGICGYIHDNHYGKLPYAYQMRSCPILVEY